MAEHEGRLISERCKATAAALKARGVKLGRKVGWKMLPEKAKYYARLSEASRRANVIDAYADLIPAIIRMRYVPTSLAGIAQHLNELGHWSQQKTPFSADVIRYALRRAGFGNLTARPRDLYGAKGLEIARAALAAAHRKWDAERYAAVMPIVRKMRAQPNSYPAICDRLTSEAIGHGAAVRIALIPFDGSSTVAGLRKLLKIVIGSDRFLSGGASRKQRSAEGVQVWAHCVSRSG